MGRRSERPTGRGRRGSCAGGSCGGGGAARRRHLLASRAGAHRAMLKSPFCCSRRHQRPTDQPAAAAVAALAGPYSDPARPDDAPLSPGAIAPQPPDPRPGLARPENNLKAIDPAGGLADRLPTILFFRHGFVPPLVPFLSAFAIFVTIFKVARFYSPRV